MQTLFPLDPAIIHLNHAAVAPWPAVTREAVIAFAQENARIGSQRYDRWLEIEAELKQRLATLIHADSADEIALLKNTSEGLSMIARGIDFQHGDNIVIPAEEFPSNRVVWQALQTQGVALRQIALDGCEQPEQQLIAAMDENTRLLSVSSVQFASGLRLQLEPLGAACRQRGILFCVDAIQSLGALDFDVQAAQADFVVADGHKWLCAPEGCALFHVRRECQDRLRLSQYGWHMLQNPFAFASNEDTTTLAIAPTAQRFECGSPNMPGIMALHASLGMLLDIGMDVIEDRLLDNTRFLRQCLQQVPGVDILSPRAEGRFAGITTFIREGVDTGALYRHLQAHGVICAERGGGIRFSPHFYTPKSKIEQAVQLVAGLAG